MAIIVCGAKNFRTEKVECMNLNARTYNNTNAVVIATHVESLTFVGDEAEILRKFFANGQALKSDLYPANMVIDLTGSLRDFSPSLFADLDPEAGLNSFLAASAVCDLIEDTCVCVSEPTHGRGDC